MKAAQITEYGDASNITINDVDTPRPGVGQVLVEVAAASLNPFDGMVIAGYAQSMAPLNFPATLGIDIAGTVTELGKGVTEFKVGDRVFGTANAMFGASGAFAEFATANTNSIAITPVNISDSEAASLPTAGVSAWQAIVKELNVQNGQKLFINGGTGGIGSFAIQIAKNAGAYVAVTASTNNVEYAKQLGADEVIDYTSTKYTEVLDGYDAALNNVRSDDTSDILTILKKGAIVASLAGSLDEESAKTQEITAINQMTHVSTESLTALASLVESSAVKPVGIQTFTLDNVKDAYAALGTKSVQGKIVITVK